MLFFAIFLLIKKKKLFCHLLCSFVICSLLVLLQVNKLDAHPKSNFWFKEINRLNTGGVSWLACHVFPGFVCRSVWCSSPPPCCPHLHRPPKQCRSSHLSFHKPPALWTPPWPPRCPAIVPGVTTVTVQPEAPHTAGLSRTSLKNLDGQGGYSRVWRALCSNDRKLPSAQHTMTQLWEQWCPSHGQQSLPSLDWPGLPLVYQEARKAELTSNCGLF